MRDDHSPSGSYDTTYTDEVIGRESTRPNLSGCSPQDNLRTEEAAQRSVATSSKWLIARTVNRGPERDSKAALEKLGFTVRESNDELFYEVDPPAGWTKSTSGYWTSVKDADGKERISQFFKGASYDRDAFVNIDG